MDEYFILLYSVVMSILVPWTIKCKFEECMEASWSNDVELFLISLNFSIGAFLLFMGELFFFHMIGYSLGHIFS
jgi:hypothetical protein